MNARDPLPGPARRSHRARPISPTAPGTRRSSRPSPTTSRSRPRARCSTPNGSSTATSTASSATRRAGSKRSKVAGPQARGRPPRGAHAGDLLRRAGDAGRAHRHDLPLRPPRQAARVQRLALRPRAVDAEVRKRPALRPRRRRRRLRGLRRDHRDHGARPPGHRAAALRRHHRDAARRAARPTCRPTSMRCARASATSASSSASTAAPATTTSSG